MIKKSVRTCDFLDQIFVELAKKHRATKFLRIKGSEAIKNFPEKNCPCIIVYYNGEMKKQWLGFGKGNVDSVEWALAQLGAVKTDLTEPPKDNDVNKMGWKKTVKNNTNDDDSDEDY
jgi:hypothetical protein